MAPPPRSADPSAPTLKEEVVISDDDEEQQQQPFLVEVTRMDEEYVWHLDLLLQQSLFDRGSAPPSPPRDRCVNDKSASPLCRHIKEEPVSLPHSLYGRFVEPVSPPPPRQGGAGVPAAQPIRALRPAGVPVVSFQARQGGGTAITTLVPCGGREGGGGALLLISSAHGHLLHYLVCISGGTSLRTRMAADKADAKEEHREHAT